VLSRRTFLATIATAAPLPFLVRRAHALAIVHLEADPRTLVALGHTVLPSALGAAGIKRAMDDFRRWMAEYREGAELNHGYGTSRLRTTGPTPATRWTRQLDELEARAQHADGHRFDALPADARARLVRDVLAAERLDRLPSVADANHVAIALLAHFYESSAAADLCYEAQIGRQTCRPLAMSSRKPLPRARTS
jgi:hypothetical protein